MGLYDLSMVLNEIEELLAKALANFQFRTREHFPVLSENGGGYIEPGGPRHRKQEDGALESVRFQGCRNEDVGIDDQPKRDHFSFWFLRAGDPVNLARVERVRALTVRFLSEHPEDFRFWGSEPHSPGY